jgi:hypothetical protein
MCASLVEYSVAGDGFLHGKDWAPATAWEVVAQDDLLDEIAKELGDSLRKESESRIPPIEDAMKKSVATMSKNQYGKLGHSAVRYMLHRYFVQRHGWYVTGLEPEGEAWNSTSPVKVLHDRVSARVQGLFERRLGGQGFELRDMAILAAMVEGFVKEEAIVRLRASYAFHELPVSGTITTFQVDRLLDTYMEVWILGKDITTSPSSEIREMTENILEYYPNWPGTERFLREVRRSTKPGHNAFTFADTVAVLMAVGDKYGHEQDKECQVMKTHLIAMEENEGSGCVRLADFYGASLDNGKWEFAEKPDYLRQLGALDESESNNPRVLVPNYLGGASNCLASSAYYSVCCLNECEGLMDHLEVELAAPQATPKRIAEVVTALPSASVSANRTLPDSLIKRLDQIAQHHRGQIPLHGRLFAQWMHHAYPRECAYPHMSGTTRPTKLDDMTAQGNDPIQSNDDMKALLEHTSKRNTSNVSARSSGSCMPWHQEEELFMPWQPEPPVRLESEPHVWSGFCLAAIASMIACASVVFLYSVRSASRHCKSGSSSEKPILVV